MNEAILYGRFSTDAQAAGDSTRRQDEMAAAYAARYGLTIVRRYFDEGKSGWHGENLTEGKLRQVIDDTEKGVNKSGTFMLVENLDRLTRLRLSKALELQARLVNLGLLLVDLSTEKTYDQDSMDDLASHLGAALQFSRAHEESNRKSGAVLKAKAARRERVRAGNGIKMTTQCPFWLMAKGTGERITFVPIPEMVAIVVRIFELCLAGLGARVITGILNREGVPPPRGKAGGWYFSAVAAVLRNRRVLGEYQPCQRQANNKRVPDGPPIAGYYPEIVSPGIFFGVQQIIAGRHDPKAIKRRRGFGGRRGRGFSNLLTGLGRCGRCGANLVFEMRPSRRRTAEGLPRYRAKFLACSDAIRGKGCDNLQQHPYDPLERDVLQLLSMFDLAALIGKPDDVDAKREAEIEAAIADKTDKADRWADQFDKDGSPTAKRRIDKLDADIAVLRADLEAHKRQAHIAEARRGCDEDAEFRALLAQLDGTTTDDDRYLLRAKLHQELTRRIEKVEINGPRVEAHLKTRPGWNGCWVVPIPMPDVGLLPAWSVEGLRTLLYTAPPPIEEVWTPEELAAWRSRG